MDISFSNIDVASTFTCCLATLNAVSVLVKLLLFGAKYSNSICINFAACKSFRSLYLYKILSFSFINLPL